MAPPVVLLLTSALLPGLAADDQPLLEAFRQAGWDPRPTVWSEPVPDAELAVIRSCWDYTERPAEFLSAIEAIGARMPTWNPPATVRWNADKCYLLELAGRGVTMPASTLTEPGDPRTLRDVARELGSDDLVLKPLVGASGKGMARLVAGDEHGWRIATATHPMLVQEFLPAVVEAGEWSLMWFHGDYSHAVRKRARVGEFRVQEVHGGTVESADPDPGIIRAAASALAAVPHPWQYARVDGVVRDGEFLVIEVELIEPLLFFTGSDAAPRLVAV